MLLIVVGHLVLIIAVIVLANVLERPHTHADWRGNPQGMWIMTLLICQVYRIGVPPEMLAHEGLGEATREFVRVWT